MAQAVGLCEAAWREADKYANERRQFGRAIIEFPAVYEMLALMRARADATRAMLYETARYVDIYKTLDDISREHKLTPEERQEMKKYNRLADAFTPVAKGMNSEYVNQNTYDAISVHGGSGFIMEYKAQRLYRDARIFSIYEGTTQLQVVAAARYITNGTYLTIMKELLGETVSEAMKPLQARIAHMVALYEEALTKVNGSEGQDEKDFLARRLYDMTAEIIMSLLIIADASKAPELFADSANVYVRMAEEHVIGKAAYIQAFRAEDLAAFEAEKVADEVE